MWPAMKRILVIGILAFAAGCSNAPIAGFLDTFFPSKPCAPLSDRSRPPPPGVRLPPPAELGGPVAPPGN
jgi:hypothetical protein